MASKKFTLLLGFLSLFITASFAQRNDAVSYWGDSSKVRTKDMPQFNEFMNNQYPYPVKPRNMWEIGLGVGPAFVLGDISPRFGYGITGSLRKAFSHALSVRGAITYANQLGLDYRLRPGSIATGVWATQAQYVNNGFVPNFRNQTYQGNLDLVVALNAASHYRGNPKTSWHVFGGYALVASKINVDALNANGAAYNFNTVNFLQSRSDIRSALKGILDGNYESVAPRTNGNRNNIGSGDTYIRHAASVGAGVARKINDRWNVGLEQRFTLTFDDNFDGFVSGRSKDVLSLTTVKLNYNIGNASKRVQPLWWINPNNYLYNEINSPRHMKLPSPVLPDADGDGITDQFDLEPNTPAGASVDSRGVSRDTDGDGVPDSRDKELLTPQSCFPVNADGVGTCPEPACCKELRDKVANWSPNNNGGDCGIGELPSIQFKSGSNALSADAKKMLNSVADRIKSMPQCNVKVVGYVGAEANKAAQQRSWDRVNAVIKYLVENQGISESRLIFSYGESGDANTVDLQGTTESGPNTVPAPHPQLRRK